MPDFATHMQILAQEFIGTVLFVDDQIPKKTESSGGLSGDDKLSGALLLDLGSLQEPEDHVLDIRKLSKSCSEKGILCCPLHTEQILTDDQQQELVDKVVKLAKKADVIVLDWQMESDAGSVAIGSTAQKIIEKYKSGNPDRDILVCIFTAESIDKVNVDEMTRDNVKVFYVWKKEGDSYEGLPQKIFCEFAKRHEGLLQSAALSAIKVIRDNTHRILSLYSAGHDTSYLSHRCLLTRPEDAEVFATELMAATFEDLMRGNEAITKYLCCQVLKDWVDTKCADLAVREFSTKSGKMDIDNEKRKEWIEIGIKDWMHKSFNAANDQKKSEQINKWSKDTAKSLAEYFSNEAATELNIKGQSSFAKLTSHAFADAVNINASTFLCIGSILKSDSDHYYLCIQPLCDSVRVDEKTYKKFLFIKLALKKEIDFTDGTNKGFNIIVTDSGTDIFLKVSEDISTLDVYSFIAPVGKDKVIMKIGENVEGIQNEQAIKFIFLAQLRSSHAQRIAMRFLHKITRIGLDESEWLRRHGAGNL